jgi:two-component system cell cycle response regulator CtrA
MRVLLIEDDSATAQSIELMLRSETFNIYTTDLGEEGIDLGKIYDYDIILLDLNLPDMSGFDVLRKLRVSKVKTPILHPFRPRGHRGQDQRSWIRCR